MWSAVKPRRPRAAPVAVGPGSERDFLRRYPAYASTGLLDDLRATDYRYLDAEGHCYLDYTGAGLVAESQLHGHTTRLRAAVYGNPHSTSPASRRSTDLVESTRAAILRFFNASPDEYAVVFTPNATGACRLVGEAFAFQTRSRLLLTQDNHNSVNGIREYARARGAAIDLVGLRESDLRVADAALSTALDRAGTGVANLFGYPAQSNFTGVQHPLTWIADAQRRGWRVLLDAAAYAPTNRLDLARYPADYVVISWYKIFGYPTGVGTLLVRRDALADMHRPWFSGGTIRAVSAQGDWHSPDTAPAVFEDGTVNFLQIPDVAAGLRWIDRIGLDTIHNRTSCLTGWLLEQLATLRHTNGRPMVRIYGPTDGRARGATITMNLLDPHGCLIDERRVSSDAAASMVSLRTGCFCNPGAGEAVFDLGTADVGLLADASSTIDGYLRRLGLPVAGGVRVSFGLASNFADASRFVRWIIETYRDRAPRRDGMPPRTHC